MPHRRKVGERGQWPQAGDLERFFERKGRREYLPEYRCQRLFGERPFATFFEPLDNLLFALGGVELDLAETLAFGLPLYVSDVQNEVGPFVKEVQHFVVDFVYLFSYLFKLFHGISPESIRIMVSCLFFQGFGGYVGCLMRGWYTGDCRIILICGDILRDFWYYNLQPADDKWRYGLKR